MDDEFAALERINQAFAEAAAQDNEAEAQADEDQVHLDEANEAFAGAVIADTQAEAEADEIEYYDRDEHPSGHVIIREAWGTAEHGLREPRLFVSDAKTKMVVWDPGEAIQMVWWPDGSQIALIRQHYEHDPNHPDIIGSPLQSEYGYFFERWSWPEHKLLSRCPISMRTGWPTDLFVRPAAGIAVFEWKDQGECGVEFISLDAAGDRQIDGAGFEARGPAEHCLLSSNGRYVVFSYANLIRWPAHRGQFARQVDLLVGLVTVIKREAHRAYDIPIIERFPAGWIPPDLEKRRKPETPWFHDTRIDLMGEPTFSDEEHLEIPLATGNVRRCNIGAAESSPEF